MIVAGHPFQKFLGILKQAAPLVLTAAGQPVAAAIVRKALGAAPDKDIGELVEEHTMTPEGIERLKLAQVALEQFQTESGIKLADIDVRDVEGARAHDIEMRKQGDRTTTQLAWLLVGSFVALSVAVVAANLMHLGATESTIVGTIIGYLLNESKQVTAFYFGSSRGSKDKDAAMATRAE